MDNSDYRIVSTTLEEIPLKDLHIQYIPMAEPEKFYDGSPNMMSLLNSPHYNLMVLFRDYGLDWKKIKSTSYWDERRYRFELGNKQWTKDHLKWHIKNRYKIFKSIKKNGYKPELHYDSRKKKDKPVVIALEPIWCTRFNYVNNKLKPKEIQNGAGRCSAMLALEHKKVFGLLAIDAKPGSMQFKNVLQIYGK